MAIEAVPASRLDDAALAALFTRCYEGYYVPVHVDAPTFRGMMDLWDVRFDASRVLLDGGDPVAVAMLGVRADAGWIGGMGVVPGARGRGLGARVMRDVLEAARALGLARVDLEVLVQNEWALPLYQSLGFGIVRRLEVLERPPGPAEAPAASPAVPVESVAPSGCLARHGPLHARERLPWQRGLEVMRRLEAALDALAVRVSGVPVCTMVLRPAPGRAGVLDIGVSDEAPPGALAAVLGAAVRRHAADTMTLLNLEAGHPAGRALRDLGFEVRHAQHEMSLAL